MSTSTPPSSATAFWIVTGLAVLSQVVTIYASSQGPSLFVLLVLGWNVAPMVVSAVFFVAGARPMAWGWLIAVAAWGAWEALSVATSHSSTAFLAFIWGPLWSFTVFGPVGALIVVLRNRRKLSAKQ